MRHPKGFTLVEMLVASAIFATVMVLTVNLFVLVLRKPLQQIDDQHVQEDVTYMFEVLSNMLNTMTIDYEAYGGTITNPSSELAIKDPNPNRGDSIRMYLSNGQILGESAFGTFPITSTTDVFIDSLKFTIYPTTDPAIFSAGANFQPSFAVQIVGHSTLNPSNTFMAQTFITLRPYVR